MILLNIAKATATALAREPLTSGMSAAVEVGFGFSPDWLGLSKTAVFTNGRTTVDVLESQWSAQGTVPIPHEVLSEEGRRVMVGIYGTDGQRVVLPTVWAELGVVLPGADPSGDESTDPTLPVWAQLHDGVERAGAAASAAQNEAEEAARAASTAQETAEAARSAAASAADAAGEVGKRLDDLTALPSPHALTLTGAVAAVYDGSTPVRVEIPEGGGGTVSVDPTLSVEGMAADAKACGDGLNEVRAALSAYIDDVNALLGGG